MRRWTECYRVVDVESTLRLIRSDSSADSNRTARRSPDLTRPDQT